MRPNERLSRLLQDQLRAESRRGLWINIAVTAVISGFFALGLRVERRRGVQGPDAPPETSSE